MKSFADKNTIKKRDGVGYRAEKARVDAYQTRAFSIWMDEISQLNHDS